MTTTTAAPTRFQIVHADVQIAPRNEQDPLHQKAIHGTVAYLPSRKEYVARSGTALNWSYWRWLPEQYRAGELLASAPDWRHVLEDREGRLGATHQLHATITPALFLTGTVLYPRKPPVVHWRSYLERHARGDYGVNGAYDSEALSEEECWGVGLLDSGRANDAAIQLGTGAVQSKFALDPEDVDLWRSANRRPPLTEQDIEFWIARPEPPPPHCYVTTLLGSRTLMWLS
jgi:hypothetical protein